MKQKMITIPFDVELAKEIQTGEHPGKIVTRDEKNDVRIVCWDAKCNFSIVALLKDEVGEEDVDMYKSNGSRYEDVDKDYSDLVLRVPEWIQYKDGDILACEVDNGDGDYCKWYAILKGSIGFMLDHTYFSSYVSYDYDSVNKTGQLTYNESCDNIDSIRLITEEEKQKFINRLKEENTDQAKDILKHYFGIEEGEGKPECEFESFQKVLVRDSDDEIWTANFFSHYDNDHAYKHVICGNSSFRICIPYNEKTKHLVGTTDNWEGE